MIDAERVNKLLHLLYFERNLKSQLVSKIMHPFKFLKPLCTKCQGCGPLVNQTDIML